MTRAPRGPSVPMLRYRPAPVLPGALCRDGDPEAWFSDEPSVAIGICLSCPELSACRSWALAEPGLHGVWAGTTEAQRRVIRALADEEEA